MIFCHHSDNIDQRMTAWLSSVSQGCSEETRFSLLSSALDAFLERFEQENGPISAIGKLGVYDNTSQEPPPERDETTTCTTCDEHVTVSDRDVPQPHITDVIESSRVASESKPSPCSQPSLGVSGTSSDSGIGTGDQQQSQKPLKRKRKHDSHKHEHHSTTKKARLDFNKNNSSLDTLSSQDLNNNCTSLHAPANQDFNNNNSSLDTLSSQDLNNNCTSLHAPANQDFNDNNSSLNTPLSQDLNNNFTSLDAPANQDCNNNYSSLDARLEQFFVCPQTNCLIPKRAQHIDINSMKSASDSAENSSSKARNRIEKARRKEERERRREERKMRREERKMRREKKARRREERARHMEDKAKHRCEKLKPVQEKPRLRGHKKERSLLKVATIRCLVRKSFQTGTYCCYRRCFLNRPRTYF